MKAKVPDSASGTVMLAMNVGQNRRRKRKMTSTTSAMLSMSENCTSFTETRMVVVRSLISISLTDGGIHRSSCGSTARIRSETERRARRGSLTDGVGSFRDGVLRDRGGVASGRLPDPCEEPRRERDGRVVTLPGRAGRQRRRRELLGGGEGLRGKAEETGHRGRVRGRRGPRLDRHRELVDDSACLVCDLVERRVAANRLCQRARAAGRGRAMRGRVAGT